MKVKYVDLAKQWEVIETDCMPKIEKFLKSGRYIGSEALEEFEVNFAKYTGHRFVITVSSGTAAIKVALQALDLKGSTCVVIQPNTFVSCATVAKLLGFEISLVDVDYSRQMNPCSLDKWLNVNRERYDNVIICVAHLEGSCADIKNIAISAEKYNCYIIEDCAQAHGTIDIENNHVGTRYADISTYSFYPTKNIGAAGELGIIATDVAKYFYSCKLFSNFGADSTTYPNDIITIGENYKPNEIQCIIVNEKLKYLDEWIEKKNKIAEIYNKNLNTYSTGVPSWCKRHSYHTYTLQVNEKLNIDYRDSILTHLNNNGIETRINYNPSIRNTKPFSHRYFANIPYYSKVEGLLFNLPMHPFLTEEEQNYIIEKVNEEWI